jgi:hypothetical protein
VIHEFSLREGFEGREKCKDEYIDGVRRGIGEVYPIM